MRVNKNEVVNRPLVCPYCMTKVNEAMPGHCDESSAHFEYGFELTNGDIYLESEIELESIDRLNIKF